MRRRRSVPGQRAVENGIGADLGRVGEIEVQKTTAAADVHQVDARTAVGDEVGLFGFRCFLRCMHTVQKVIELDFKVFRVAGRSRRFVVHQNRIQLLANHRILGRGDVGRRVGIKLLAQRWIGRFVRIFRRFGQIEIQL